MTKSMANALIMGGPLVRGSGSKFTPTNSTRKGSDADASTDEGDARVGDGGSSRNTLAGSSSTPLLPGVATPPASRASLAERNSSFDRSIDRSSSIGSLRGILGAKRGSNAVPRGDVTLCVRVKPGQESADPIAKVDEGGGVIRLSPGVGFRQEEAVYHCDLAMGPETSQDQAYAAAVSPIVDVVLRGYNGAVIAYGQTGSGKTHTMLGEMQGAGQGMAPRAVAALFASKSPNTTWSMEVMVLEIYNERVRDLLSQSNTPAHVDIHELPRSVSSSGVPSFGCPDATRRVVATAEEALVALQEGMRRRETARTDMNHSSSRSHLIFAMHLSMGDKEVGAVLKSKLLLVDLAGSERLKRSMGSMSQESAQPVSPAGASPQRDSRRASMRTPSPRSPRDQRREAAEINKSLSQLALVINRLTSTGPGTVQQVPYRDSMLTRLLADCFGGSSKTCLIVACSPSVEDREETKCSLEFGRRAKLVKNRPEINVEVIRNEHTDTAVFKALVAKEVSRLERELDQVTSDYAACEERRNTTESKLAAGKAEAEAQVRILRQELAEIKDAHADLHKRFADTVTSASNERDLLERQAESTRHNNQSLHRQLQELRGQQKDLLQKQATLEDELRSLEQERNDLKQSLAKQVAEVVNLKTLKLEMQQAMEAAAQEKAQMSRSIEDVTNRRDREALELAQFKQQNAQLQEQLEESRGEVSRLGREKAALQMQLDHERSRHSQELAIATSRLEAEKVLMQQQWHEAAAEAWNLLQSKVPAILGSSGGSISTTGVSTTCPDDLEEG